MPRRPDIPVRDMFETRTHAWKAVGLERELSPRRVSRARREALVALPLIVGVVVLYSHRHTLFPGLGVPVRVATVLALVVLGYAFARAIGRWLAPALFRRLDPGTAGTVGFLIRLATIVIALLVALRIAGIEARTLALGGAVAAVIFGLAAQQTFGNLIAGTVLLSARPFRVGDRVRLLGGAVGGRLEGVVSSLGLLYTSLAAGDDRILVPNNVILGLAVMPLREPDSLALRARLPGDVRPSAVQELLEKTVDVPTRDRPHIDLEELDGDDVVVRISATPIDPADGARLADQILAAVAGVARAERGDDSPAANGAGGPGDGQPARGARDHEA